MYLTYMDLIKLFNNVQNLSDPIIHNHGIKVGFLTYKILQAKAKYSKSNIISYTMAANFHDLGILSNGLGPEFIRRNLSYPNLHSLLGSTVTDFIGINKPFYSQIVKYHHLRYDEVGIKTTEDIDPVVFTVALANQLALVPSGIYSLDKILTDDGAFLPEDVEIFRELQDKYNLIKQIQNESFQAEYYELMNEQLDSDMAYAGIKILAVAQDFINELTASRTYITLFLCNKITNLMGLQDIEKTILMLTSTLLHFGKIKNNTDLLSEKDYEADKNAYIREQVATLEYLCQGLENYDNIRKLLKNQFERLDGSGAPLGIKEVEFNLFTKIITIINRLAELFQPRPYKQVIPYGQICNILVREAEDGKFDNNIVNLIVKNKDKIFPDLLDGILQRNTNYINITKKINDLMNSQKDDSINTMLSDLQGEHIAIDKLNKALFTNTEEE